MKRRKMSKFRPLLFQQMIIISLREPNASAVENEGYGDIVASVGELGGKAPYTSYNARSSYIKNNKEIISGFVKAINNGLKFVRENDSNTIAKSIYNFFPDMSLNELKTSIDRYKNQDTWNETTKLEKDSFDHLQEIMVLAGELKEKVPFNDLVDNTYN